MVTSQKSCFNTCSNDGCVTNAAIPLVGSAPSAGGSCQSSQVINGHSADSLTVLYDLISTRQLLQKPQQGDSSNQQPSSQR
jgi:hypothetical protein